MCEALRELMKEDFEKQERETKQETLLEAIRNLMETMKCSADQAMAALKIPEADKRKYIAKLQNKRIGDRQYMQVIWLTAYTVVLSVIRSTKHNDCLLLRWYKTSNFQN